MTPEQFVYWLQGFFEISNPESLNVTQTQIIQDHLKLVFKKETPDFRHNPYDPVCDMTGQSFSEELERALKTQKKYEKEDFINSSNPFTDKVC